MKFTLILSSFFILLISGCKQEGDVVSAVVDIPSETPSTFISAIASSDKESEVLNTLVTEFDSKMCGASKDRSIEDCYKLHANEMRMNFMQKHPYTSTFPYDGSFDLSMVSSIDSLNFLTKKCGFQQKESGKVINYYCLKSEGRYMDYLKRIQSESPIILTFYKEYQDSKTISPNIRQGVMISSLEDLDFSKEGHRLFYMIFHLLTNEEKLAAAKI